MTKIADKPLGYRIAVGYLASWSLRLALVGLVVGGAVCLLR